MRRSAVWLEPHTTADHLRFGYGARRGSSEPLADLQWMRVSACEGFREARTRLFANDLAAGARRSTSRDGSVLLELTQEATISVARLGEDVAHGQHVARYLLEGSALPARR